MEQEHGYRLKTSAKMMRWMLEKRGLRTPTKAWKAILGKDKVSDISTMEKNLKWIPVAERFIKVSDANLYEWFNQQLGTNAKIGEKYRQMLDDEEKMDELSFAEELKKGPIQNSENDMTIMIIAGIVSAGIIGGVVLKLKKN